MNRLVGGMDGCRSGWVLVTIPIKGLGESRVEVVTDLSGIAERVDAGELAAVAIDMPIGLPASGPRACDLQARKLIGPRRSSVFPTPVRGVLEAETYEEAARASIAISGKGISRQVFSILPRIRDVDRFMTPERQRLVVEMHPELGSAILTGRPMDHHKSTPEGRAERLAALRMVFSDVDLCSVRPPVGAQHNDVLDAFVGAWTARRWASQTHKQLGGELDQRGLRMEMIA